METWAETRKTSPSFGYSDNGIVIRKNDGNRALYFISKTIESDLAEMNNKYYHNKKN